MKSWSSLHKNYSAQSWIDKTNIFALDIKKFLPKTGKILDLGAGQGQDTRFFADLGYDVVSCDISDAALKISQEKLSQDLQNKVNFLKLDIAENFPFGNESFDIVYSHLALHYFDLDTTTQIFDEIYRVLRPNGVFAALFNSITDPEYNTGSKIEEDFFLIESISKRFFSVDTLKNYIGKFAMLLLDSQGETYKDSKKGVHHLIRFVGKKL